MQVLAGDGAVLEFDRVTLSTGFLVKTLAAALIGGLTSLPDALVGGLRYFPILPAASIL